MSGVRPSAALRIWRARRRREDRDRWYGAYLLGLTAVVAIAPTARALWALIASETGVAVLTSASAPTTVSLTAATAWAAALLLGRLRGPALLPTVPLHALLSSDIPRSVALRTPLVRAGVIVVAAFAATAALAGAVPVTIGVAPGWQAVTFAFAGAAAGAVTTVAWLAGQVLPRAAIPVSIGILVAAAAGASSPALSGVLPWGWLGAAYPLAGGAVRASAALVLLAVVLAALAPAMMDRLTRAGLEGQAAAWETATTFGSGLDLGGAATAYRARPRIGRRLSAVRPHRHLLITFVIQDAVTQLRRPTRLALALTAVFTAAWLLALAHQPHTPSVLLSASAGLALYSATAALASGLRFAAELAGDHPLLGISDGALVLRHAAFPLALTTTSTTVGTAGIAAAAGVAVGPPLLAAGCLSVAVLAVRLSATLKGPLPLGLLTPVSTPAGDVGVVLRIVWAVAEPLLAIGSGAAVAVLGHSPGVFLLLAAGVAALVGIRWRRRR